MKTSARTEKLDMRVTVEAKRRLVAAAAAEQRSVSEFVLSSALDRANETLADRKRFGLDEAGWSAFQAALNGPARDLPRVAQLLHEPSIFEDETAH
ncbi:MAG: DUF1778 domain-containing protein [Thermomicrobiales bacterium]|nr:DUF1778 domain-containing protein [Thermomicrobiales bacterium]